jgi:tetratricopeptide (TPR) repeat protein
MLRLRPTLCGALAVLAGVLLPALASAQECPEAPTDAQRQEAEALFVAGSGAIDGLRWVEAIDRFRRSYSLSCNPAALYNLGMALRGIGRHREARDTFDRLIRENPQLPAALRAQVTEFRREESARVAMLELMGIAPEVRIELSFDGRHVADEGARPMSLEADPGSHSLVARIPDHQPFLWDGELSEGQHQAIDVLFEPNPVTPGFDALPLILGIAGAVLAGALIGLAIYLQDDAQLDPLSTRVTTVD